MIADCSRIDDRHLPRRSGPDRQAEVQEPGPWSDRVRVSNGRESVESSVKLRKPSKPAARA
jgi:hypothetical protein